MKSNNEKEKETIEMKDNIDSDSSSDEEENKGDNDKDKDNKDKQNASIQPIQSVQPTASNNNRISAKQPEDPLTIYLKTNIFSIREINTIEQSFTADIFLEASWSNPKYVGKTADQIDCAKEVSYTFINLISKETEEFWVR